MSLHPLSAVSSTVDSRVRCITRGLGVLLISSAIWGCAKTNPPAPPFPPPASTFFKNVDLQSVVDKSAPKGIEWGGEATKGGTTTELHWNKSFERSFQGSADDVDQFLKSLRTEFLTAEESQRAKLVELVTLDTDELPKAVARLGSKPPADGKPVEFDATNGFHLDYEDGNTRGEILVIVSRIKSAANEKHPLKLSVDVAEPVTWEEATPAEKANAGK